MLNHLIDPPDESDYVACYECGGAVHVDRCYEDKGAAYCESCAQEALNNGEEWIDREVRESVDYMIKQLQGVM